MTWTRPLLQKTNCFHFSLLGNSIIADERWSCDRSQRPNTANLFARRHSTKISKQWPSRDRLNGITGRQRALTVCSEKYQKNKTKNKSFRQTAALTWKPRSSKNQHLSPLPSDTQLPTGSRPASGLRQTYNLQDTDGRLSVTARDALPSVSFRFISVARGLFAAWRRSQGPRRP